MRVLKFGGTSVGSSENILKVLAILKDYNSQQIEIAVVVSAMSQMTNTLVKLGELASTGDESYLVLLKEFEEKHITAARELISVKKQSAVFASIKRKINDLEDVLHGVFLLKELSLRAQDLILSHGERLNAYTIAEAGKERGLKTVFVDARTIIKTDSTFGAAKINFEVTNKNITQYFTENKGVIPIITGFVSSNENGETTTLGRGGSDYTASVVAAGIGAEVVEIWTDVNGVMTADPRKVKNAFSLPAITYVEAMEMSHFGAKVIYPPTLQPVFTKKIPIRIKNTFQPEFEGTLISEKSGEAHKLRVKGISSINDIALLSVQGSSMVGIPGVSSRIFGALSKSNVNIILITQASSEHSISFAVDPADAVKAKNAIEEEFHYEIGAGRLEKVNVKNNLSIVAIIGENMLNTPGISGRMFSALGKNGINIAAIAQGSSELNISAVIDKKDISKALNALHDGFFLAGTRTLNVFMVGPGLIGSTLLDQIQEQSSYLSENKSLNIKVVAIANSKKMLFNEEGIDLKHWKTSLEACTNNMSFDGFVEEMNKLNLPNSVFVDNTSNKEIVAYYEKILGNSIAIVTPNKVANSSSYAYYKTLKNTAFARNVDFLYETNVGAGLPVIRTLQDLIHSGDEILKIEGVLSGSLSYIFNTYDGTTTFKEVVLRAKENGFTEPDPRDDLNGMDVARKILILSREAGYELEPEDVKVENILPEACIKAKTVEEFFDELEKADEVFQKLSADALATGQKLRFIASMEEGKVNVGLKLVGMEHPFYSMSGSDNMISYTTKRYQLNPLVIKGPGAGAEVTAAGVFADIISISNSIS